MKRAVVLAALVLVFVLRAAALSCMACASRPCPPTPSCPGDVVKDACGCCDKCAKMVGEKCGGPWGITGTCSSALSCVKGRTKYTGIGRAVSMGFTRMAVGVCQRKGNDKECPANSHMSRCKGRCRPTCTNPNPACTRLCVRGCSCDKGYVWEGRKCIPLEQCQSAGGERKPDARSADTCAEPKKVGLCRAARRRFYFDSSERKCKSFIYGGCGGNRNNFLTMRDCETTCAVIDLKLANSVVKGQNCPAHSRWSQCGSACRPSCENPSPTCTRQCVPGCTCETGRVWEGDGCVLLSDCPAGSCQHDGKTHRLGESWADKRVPGTLCSCSQNGTVQCDQKQCPRGEYHTLGDDGMWTCKKTADMACPEGYTKPRRASGLFLCYRFERTPTTYRRAEDTCRAEGGRLATVRDRMSLYPVLVGVSRKIRKSTWIGLSDKETEKKLVWSDGVPYTSLDQRRWTRQLQGSNTPENDCGYMSRPHSYRWLLGECSSQHAFVCEYDPFKTSRQG
ncbi:cysteine-rich motor neuron 1 protein-like [Branchiostoma lanceolatum]|uniref:cysteine-rich motor neuron 1 protein-like n=1 Tax=Branchiostoma lanceolatum TaxID=7740 RepID=UPI003451CABE